VRRNHRPFRVSAASHLDTDVQLYSSIENRISTRLPANYWIAHELCFKVHDVMTELLVSGRKQSAFHVTFEFKDDADREAFENSDIFDWLEQSRGIGERTAVLVTTVFPAVLGDMMHCFYEALETSRKGKLTASFMLLRKPLQESLFLLESVLVDPHGSAEKMTVDPGKLGSQGAGGLEVHTKRIQKVLDLLGEADVFDAGYLAQLRYDKAAADGFDGICNKAMHLFTDHKSIKTEPLNINFIFSDYDTSLTQWSYLYSRLPYLLIYIHRIVERIGAVVAPAHPAYVNDMHRRISALVLLWWDTVEPPYANDRLHSFVQKIREWLIDHCREEGHAPPNYSGLPAMADSGSFQDEPPDRAIERNEKYAQDAAARVSASRD
jgi:hypothetical protein